MRVTRRAVTLVELLIVAFVISVLLLISVPVIRNFKVKQDDLINIRNLGATMQDFYAWGHDHDGVVVNAGLPDTAPHNWFYTELGEGIEPEVHYLNHDSQWPRVLLADGFTPGPHWHASTGPETNERLEDLLSHGPAIAFGWIDTWYRFPTPLRTRPEVWSEDGPQGMTFHQLSVYYKRVRFSDVRHPSAKGVLVYRRLSGEGRLAVAFADGHAAIKRESDAQPTAMPPRTVVPVPGRPVFSTLNGHEGRDF